MENNPGLGMIGGGHVAVVLCAAMSGIAHLAYRKLRRMYHGCDPELVEKVDTLLTRLGLSGDEKVRRLADLLRQHLGPGTPLKEGSKFLQSVLGSARAGNKNDPSYSHENSQILHLVKDMLVAELASRDCLKVMAEPAAPATQSLTLAMIEASVLDAVDDPRGFVTKVKGEVVGVEAEEGRKEREEMMQEASRLALHLCELKKLMQAAAESGACNPKDGEEFAAIMDRLDIPSQIKRYEEMRGFMEDGLSGRRKDACAKRLDELWCRSPLTPKDKAYLIERLAEVKQRDDQKVKRILGRGLEGRYPSEIRAECEAVRKAMVGGHPPALCKPCEQLVEELTKNRIDGIVLDIALKGGHSGSVDEDERALTRAISEFLEPCISREEKEKKIEGLVSGAIEKANKKPWADLAVLQCRKASHNAVSASTISQLVERLKQSGKPKQDASQLLEDLLTGRTYEQKKRAHEALANRVREESKDPAALAQLTRLWNARTLSPAEQIDTIKGCATDPALSEEQKKREIARALSHPCGDSDLLEQCKGTKAIIQDAIKTHPEAKPLFDETDAVSEHCARRVRRGIQDSKCELKLEVLADLLASVVEPEPPAVQSEIVSATLQKAAETLGEDELGELNRIAPQVAKLTEAQILANEIRKQAQLDNRDQAIELLNINLAPVPLPLKSRELDELLKMATKSAPSGMKAKLEHNLRSWWNNRLLPQDELRTQILSVVQDPRVDSKRIEDAVPTLLCQGTERTSIRTMQDRTRAVLADVQAELRSSALRSKVEKAGEQALRDHSVNLVKQVFAGTEPDETGRIYQMQSIFADLTENLSKEKSKERAQSLMDNAARGQGVEKKKHMVYVAEEAFWRMSLLRALANRAHQPRDLIISDLRSILNDAMAKQELADRGEKFDRLLHDIVRTTPLYQAKAAEQLMREAWEGRRISDDELAYLIRHILLKPGITDEGRKEQIIGLLKRNTEGLAPKDIRQRLRLVIIAVKNKEKNALLEKSAREVVGSKAEAIITSILEDANLRFVDRKEGVIGVVMDITEGLPEDEQAEEFARVKRVIRSTLPGKEGEEMERAVFSESKQLVKDREKTNALLQVLLNDKLTRKQKGDDALGIINTALKGMPYEQQQARFQELRQTSVRDAPKDKERMVQEMLDEIWAFRKLPVEDIALMLEGVLKRNIEDQVKLRQATEVLLLVSQGYYPAQMKERVKVVGEIVKRRNEGKVPSAPVMEAACREAVLGCAAASLADIVNRDKPGEQETKAKSMLMEVMRELKEEQQMREVDEIVARVQLPGEKKKEAERVARRAAIRIQEETMIARLKEKLLDNALSEESRAAAVMSVMLRLTRDLPYPEMKKRYAEVLNAMCAGSSEPMRKTIAQRLHEIWSRRRLSEEEQVAMIEEELGSPAKAPADQSMSAKSVLLNYAHELEVPDFKAKAKRVFSNIASRKKLAKPEPVLETAVEDALCEHAGRRIHDVAMDAKRMESDKVLETVKLIRTVADDSKQREKYIQKTVEIAQSKDRPVVEKTTKAALERLKYADLIWELKTVMTDEKLKEETRKERALRCLAQLMMNIPHRMEEAKLKEVVEDVKGHTEEPKKKAVSEKLLAYWRDRAIEEGELIRIILEKMTEKPPKPDGELKKELEPLILKHSEGKVVSELRRRNGSVLGAVQKEVKNAGALKEVLDDSLIQMATRRITEVASENSTKPIVRSQVDRTQEVVLQLLEGLSREEKDRNVKGLFGEASKIAQKPMGERVEKLLKDALALIADRTKAERYAAIITSKDLSEAEKMRRLQELFDSDLKPVPYTEKRNYFEKIEADALKLSPGAPDKTKDLFRQLWRHKHIPEDERADALLEVVRNVMKASGKKEEAGDIMTQECPALEFERRFKPLLDQCKAKGASTHEIAELRKIGDELLVEKAVRLIKPKLEDDKVSMDDRKKQILAYTHDLGEGVEFTRKLPLCSKAAEELSKACPHQKELVNALLEAAKKRIEYFRLVIEVRKLGDKLRQAKQLDDLLDFALTDCRYFQHKPKLIKVKEDLTKDVPEAKHEAVQKAIDETYMKRLQSRPVQVELIRDILTSKAADERKKEETIKMLQIGNEPLTTLKQIRDKTTIVMNAARKDVKEKASLDVADLAVSELYLREAARLIGGIVRKPVQDGKAENIVKFLEEAVEKESKEKKASDIARICDQVLMENAEAKPVLSEVFEILNEEQLAGILVDIVNSAVPYQEKRYKIEANLVKALGGRPYYAQKRKLGKVVERAARREPSKKERIIELVYGAWYGRSVTEEEQSRMVEEVLQAADVPEEEKREDMVRILAMNSGKLNAEQVKKRVKMVIKGVRRKPGDAAAGKLLQDTEDEVVSERAAREAGELLRSTDLTEQEKRDKLALIWSVIGEDLSPDEQKAAVSKVTKKIGETAPKGQRMKFEELAMDVSSIALHPADEPIVEKSARRRMTEEEKTREAKNILMKPEALPENKQKAVMMLIEEGAEGLKGTEKKERVRRIIQGIRKYIPPKDASHKLIDDCLEEFASRPVRECFSEKSSKKRKERFVEEAFDTLDGLEEKEMKLEVDRQKAMLKREMKADPKLLEDLYYLLKLRYYALDKSLPDEGIDKRLQDLLVKDSDELELEEATRKMEELEADSLRGLPPAQLENAKKRVERVKLRIIGQRKQKLEKERKQKLEADRMQKLEADRMQKLEEEKNQKLEADRLQKLEADRIQKLEADRIQKLEAERMQKLEADRRQKLEEEEKKRQQAEEEKSLQVTSYDELDKAVASGKHLVVNGFDVLNIERYKGTHKGGFETLHSCIGREISRFAKGIRTHKSKMHAHSDKFLKDASNLKVSEIKDDLCAQMFKGIEPGKTLGDYVFNMEMKKGVTDMYFACSFVHPAISLTPLYSNGSHFGKYFIVTSLSRKISGEAGCVFCQQNELDDKITSMSKAMKNNEEFEGELMDIEEPLKDGIWMQFERKGEFNNWLFDAEEEEAEMFRIEGPYGPGLRIDPDESGLVVAVTCGKSVLHFYDLVAYLLRVNGNELGKKIGKQYTLFEEENMEHFLQPGFKFMLMASVDNKKQEFPNAIAYETLAAICEEHKFPNFQFVLREGTEPLWDAEYLKKTIPKTASSIILGVPETLHAAMLSALIDAGFKKEIIRPLN